MKRIVIGLFTAAAWLAASPGMAALHVVDVKSNSFDPSNLQIEQNDQVRWEYFSGTTHTTTAGTPGNPSGLWNATISSSQQTFTRTFSQLGNFPYYCSPHAFTGVIVVEAPSGVLDDPADAEIPQLLALAQNSPNPFNAATQIRYSLDKYTPTELAIYNILGQRVRTLVTGGQPPGIHEVTWDGRDDSGREAPSGIYFTRLITSGAMLSRKMVLLR